MKTLVSNLRVLPVILLTVLLASCGGDGVKVVESLKVKTETIDNDVFLGFNSVLNFGSMTLPQAEIPVYHPQGNELIGKLTMGPLAGGKNQLGIDINLSSVTGLASSSATLPNGNVLPLIAGNEAVVIGVGPNRKIKIYLSIVNGAEALGVAIPISAFDAIGARVGATSLFPVFSVEGIIGSAGMYTSFNNGQNGFGLFLDVHSVIQKIPVPKKSARGMVSMRSTLSASPKAFLNYSSHKPSKRKERTINRMLYKLNRKKAKLK